MPIYSSKFFSLLIEPTWRLIVLELSLYCNNIVFNTRQLVLPWSIKLALVAASSFHRDTESWRVVHGTRRPWICFDLSATKTCSNQVYPRAKVFAQTYHCRQNTFEGKLGFMCSHIESLYSMSRRRLCMVITNQKIIKKWGYKLYQKGHIGFWFIELKSYKKFCCNQKAC